MRVAITGASGFIGSALGRSIVSRGDAVIRIGRGPGSDVVWNPSDGSIDAAALEGIDAVVHMAGEPIGDKRWTANQKARIRDSRVYGTRLISETIAGLNRPPSVLLSGSAIGYYGDRGETSLSESSKSGDGFLAEVCDDWEQATAPAADAGIRVVHLRTGIVLDSGEGMLKRMLPLYRLGLGGRLGSGRQFMSWISLADQVGGILWALDNPLVGPVNLTAPSPVTNREFNDSLGRALRRPARFAVPGFVPKLVFGGELVDQLILGSANVMPDRLIESGFVHRHPVLSDFLAEEVAR